MPNIVLALGGLIAISLGRNLSAQDVCSYELLAYGQGPEASAAALPPRAAFEMARDATMELRKLSQNPGQNARAFEEQRLALRRQIQIYDAGKSGRRKDPPEIADARAQLAAMESGVDPAAASVDAFAKRRVTGLREIVPAVKAGYAAIPHDLQGLRTAVKAAEVYGNWSACTEWTTFGANREQFSAQQTEADGIREAAKQDVVDAVIARVKENGNELLVAIAALQSSLDAGNFRRTYLDTQVRELNTAIADTGLTGALEEQHRRLTMSEHLTAELKKVDNKIASLRAQSEFFGNAEWFVTSDDEEFRVSHVGVVDGVTYSTTLVCISRPVPAVRVEVLVDPDAKVQWRRVPDPDIELFVTRDGVRERYLATFVGEDNVRYVNHLQFMFVDTRALEERFEDQVERGDLLGAFTTMIVPRFVVPLETNRFARELLLSAYVTGEDVAGEVTVADLGSVAGPGLDRFVTACGI